jgi:hypothetical protein
MHHKIRMARRRAYILRNGCLSASATSRTNQDGPGLVAHSRSMG